jgi:sugar/nucleoside kinase (ribokinase family)
LALSSIVKAGEDELEIILSHYEKSLQDLVSEYRLREIVVTRGGRGGYVLLPSGETFSYEAEPVQAVTDPTGAGDVFFATYVASRYFRGESVPDSCARAAKVAGLQVSDRHIARAALRI